MARRASSLPLWPEHALDALETVEVGEVVRVGLRGGPGARECLLTVVATTARRFTAQGLSAGGKPLVRVFRKEDGLSHGGLPYWARRPQPDAPPAR